MAEPVTDKDFFVTPSGTDDLPPPTLVASTPAGEAEAERWIEEINRQLREE